MKVILLDHVESLGLPGQLANVKTGFYRNYLGPRRLAVEATESNIKGLEQKRAKLDKRANEIVSEARELGDRLKDVTLEFLMKVAHANRLFGSVGINDIAAKLAEAGFEIERRKITLGDPIKTVGTHTVAIKLRPDIIVPITIIVEGEGGPEEEELPIEAASDGEDESEGGGEEASADPGAEEAPADEAPAESPKAEDSKETKSDSE